MINDIGNKLNILKRTIKKSRYKIH